MSTLAHFIISVDPSDYDAVKQQLEALDIVEKVHDQNVKIGSTTKDSIICHKTYEDSDGVERAIETMKAFIDIKKIKSVTHTIDPQSKFDTKFLISSILSAIVTLVSVAGVVYGLKPNATPIEYLVNAVIPAILSFVTIMIVKYLS
jgi:hypothetical protein